MPEHVSFNQLDNSKIIKFTVGMKLRNRWKEEFDNNLWTAITNIVMSDNDKRINEKEFQQLKNLATIFDLVGNKGYEFEDTQDGESLDNQFLIEYNNNKAAAGEGFDSEKYLDNKLKELKTFKEATELEENWNRTIGTINDKLTTTEKDELAKLKEKLSELINSTSIDKPQVNKKYGEIKNLLDKYKSYTEENLAQRQADEKAVKDGYAKTKVDGVYSLGDGLYYIEDNDYKKFASTISVSDLGKLMNGEEVIELEAAKKVQEVQDNIEGDVESAIVETGVVSSPEPGKHDEFNNQIQKLINSISDEEKYGSKEYTIKSGDTLGKIALENYKDITKKDISFNSPEFRNHLALIAKMNGIENVNLIRVGEKIKLPTILDVVVVPDSNDDGKPVAENKGAANSQYIQDKESIAVTVPTTTKDNAQKLYDNIINSSSNDELEGYIEQMKKNPVLAAYVVELAKENKVDLLDKIENEKDFYKNILEPMYNMHKDLGFRLVNQNQKDVEITKHMSPQNMWNAAKSISGKLIEVEDRSQDYLNNSNDFLAEVANMEKQDRDKYIKTHEDGSKVFDMGNGRWIKVTYDNTGIKRVSVSYCNIKIDGKTSNSDEVSYFNYGIGLNTVQMNNAFEKTIQYNNNGGFDNIKALVNRIFAEN